MLEAEERKVLSASLVEENMSLIDFGIDEYSQRAAATEHKLAVTRDYISQPRLSK